MFSNYVRSNPAAFLLFSATGSGVASAGSVIDSRACSNQAFVAYYAPAASAIFSIQASHDTTGWFPVGTFTATSTSATANLSGAWYPYVRAFLNACYSGGGNTGFANVYYAPKLIG